MKLVRREVDHQQGSKRGLLQQQRLKSKLVTLIVKEQRKTGPESGIYSLSWSLFSL